jgi:hypothetical protein
VWRSSHPEGGAKTSALMGQGFAEANLQLMKAQQGK